MTDEELNRLIFVTIDNLYQVSSARVSMWSLSNKYAFAPYFRFRLTENDTAIYEHFGKAISLYKGNFDWSMGKHEDPRSLYIIAPVRYIDRVLHQGIRRKNFLEKMSEEDYKSMVDKVIEDVPGLASHIDWYFSTQVCKR
jgi:hypothetical protein